MIDGVGDIFNLHSDYLHLIVPAISQHFSMLLQEFYLPFFSRLIGRAGVTRSFTVDNLADSDLDTLCSTRSSVMEPRVNV